MTHVIANYVPAIDDRELMLVPRAWAQWQRNGVCYRQFHSDDGDTKTLARVGDTWFVLRADQCGRLRWTPQLLLELSYAYAYGGR